MKTLNRKAMYELVKLNDLNSEIYKKYNRSYQTLPDFLLYEFLLENGYLIVEDDEEEEYDDDTEMLIDEDCDCDCDRCDEGDSDTIVISKEVWYGIKALIKTLNTYFN